MSNVNSRSLLGPNLVQPGPSPRPLWLPFDAAAAVMVWGAGLRRVAVDRVLFVLGLLLLLRIEPPCRGRKERIGHADPRLLQRLVQGLPLRTSFSSALNLSVTSR
jgi:hypothetical protein